METNSTTKEFQILAKSVPEIPLKQHIDDCLHIVRQLITSFPNLPVDQKEVFWDLLIKSIIFHDTGKSHKEFQKILHKCSKSEWSHQRHELFSLFFIHQTGWDKEICEWVSYAVTGHHRCLEELHSFISATYPIGNNSFVSPKDLNYSVECEKLYKKRTWKLLHAYGFYPQTEVSFNIQQYIRQEARKKHKISESDYMLRLLLVGLLKQCDHLASAGIKDIKNINSNDLDFLFEREPYNHQKKAYLSEGNIILSSPTGSGKTETALLWLKKQLEIKGQGRVFYVLPYTASINAMYERLNSKIDKTENKVGMLHGKLLQYLETKMSSDKTYSSEQRDHLLEEFKTLITPFKIVTPFQLLKHLFGLNGFEKGISEWSGGYFIFDEIHAYDENTFAQILILLRFLTTYMHANVHIMTATLPVFQQKLIEDAIGKHQRIVADDALYDEFERHQIQLQEGRIQDSIPLIQADIDTGKKVLVVCNTVEQAQNLYNNLTVPADKKKILLHSSFNAEDRNRKELALQKDDVFLLVGTQAIEVSLDIDYDTIYTEPAPLDALIQRFGRVNRRREKGICICHIFTERNEKDRFIYNNDVVERTLAALKVIEKQNQGIIREKEIQAWMNQVYPTWEEKQKDKFDLIYSSFSYFVENELSPLVYDSTKEDEFYKQFDSVKVLPVQLVNDYKTYLEQHEFIKADGLLVSIRESRLWRLLQEQEASKDIFYYENITKDKLERKEFFVIKRVYNEELGLLINEAIQSDPNDLIL